jgi:hypothetical protein
VAKIEPRMAAWMTMNWSLLSRTMKRMISTTDPSLSLRGQHISPLLYSEGCSLRRLDQNTKDVRELSRQFLASESDQVGAGDHSNVGEDEDQQVVLFLRIWPLSADWMIIGYRAARVEEDDNSHLTANVAGTTGHRMLQNLDALLDDVQTILKKCSGSKPLLPLSPAGLMPGVFFFGGCAASLCVGREASLELELATFSASIMLLDAMLSTRKQQSF